ncbi:MAG: magnesium transporter [Bilophila wadsworthia]
MALLAVLMPMVANQAGNTGQQALAVMIRQLATEKFDRKRAWIAVLREGKIGIASGVIMAMLACVGVWFTSSSPELGMVMGAALMGDMLLGALAGGSIPLIFRAVAATPRRLPASSSPPSPTARASLFLGLATAFCCRKCEMWGKGGPFCRKGLLPSPHLPSSPQRLPSLSNPCLRFT